MQRFTITAILAAIFLCGLSLSASAVTWQWHSIGGGNAEKIVISEDPDGAWCFEKDGGAFWIPYDSENDSWGDWQGFDANYCWHMGGDVLPIGPTGGTLIPYALNATMQEHHIYEWDGDSWEYADHMPNSYYQYHDAQFFASNDGTTNFQWFLVSTWQKWDGDPNPNNLYLRGIYLISDGQPPDPNDPVALIDGTEGKTYPKIYRDPYDAQVFYTWRDDPQGDFEFQRIDVTGTGPGQFSASVSRDFTINGYDLKDVAQGGFYQYYDNVSGLVHQYLLATNDVDPDPIVYDVWHREGLGGNLGASDWDIVWPDVKRDLDGEPANLAARMNGLFEHDICIFTEDHCLAFYNTESRLCIEPFLRSDSPQAFITFLSFCLGAPPPQMAGIPLSSAVPAIR